MVSEALELNKGGAVPSWLEANADAMSVTVAGLPKREDFHFPIQEQLIVELCSK